MGYLRHFSHVWVVECSVDVAQTFVKMASSSHLGSTYYKVLHPCMQT